MEQRERWDSRTAFVLAAIGSAVGLGNVWRFPYVCYANGGGAFFIPYLIALITAGIPLMILELGLGQMMQGSAPASLRRTNHHTEWVGWFSLLVATIISIYYALIMAWSFDYLYYSITGIFQDSMPWSVPTGDAPAGGDHAAQFFRMMRYGLAEGDPAAAAEPMQYALTAERLWQPVWPVIIGLVLTWATVYWIICKGVHRVGQVVKWTVPLPVIVLLILALRGLTLEGAADGIVYYLSPNFEALRNPSTWLAAYGQIFFSLTLGFGVMIAYGSYQSRKSDVVNNAFITCFANCSTSFLAGFAVFSVIGYLARDGRPVGEVVAGGPGLAFVTYPTAIAKMGELGAIWPPLVAILFFVMLLFLGIDSLFSLVEGAVAGLRDRYPWMSQSRVTAVYCMIALAIGIVVFGNRAGLHWLDIVDHWANDYGLVVVGLLQCVIVGYFFHTNDLRDYVNKVSEVRLWGWWELCVRIITPAILLYLIAANLLSELTLNGLYGATGTDFDEYLWVAPALFALLFIIAFTLARMWTYLALIGSGGVVAGVAYLLLRWGGAAAEGRSLAVPAIFCGLAASVLLGGLILCLLIARRGPKHPVHPVDSGHAGEEKRPQDASEQGEARG